MTSRHAYPPSALAGDYLRAAGGAAVALLPLATVPLDTGPALLFAGLAALFVGFGARTVLRQLGPFELSEGALSRVGPWPRRLEWAALEAVRLAWYATRRDGRDGWAELFVRGAGTRLRLDSRIEGFREIASAAARAAAARGLPLNQATAANFMALGLPVPQGRA